MKNYYSRLDADRKKEIKEKFLNSNECLIYKKANKMFNLSLFGMIFGVFALGFDLTYKNGLANILLDVFLFAACLWVLIKMNRYKMQEINKFAIKTKEK